MFTQHDTFATSSIDEGHALWFSELVECLCFDLALKLAIH